MNILWLIIAIVSSEILGSWMFMPRADESYWGRVVSIGFKEAEKERIWEGVKKFNGVLLLLSAMGFIFYAFISAFSGYLFIK